MEQALQGTNYLQSHQELYKNGLLFLSRNNKDDRNTRQTKTVKSDTRLIEICKKIGYAPVHQWKFLRFTKRLNKKILQEGDEDGILKEHPNVERLKKLG